MTLFETCRILELPKVYDPKGALTFVYNNEHIPFKVKRTFFTYDVPGGQDRGAHAHIETHQFLVSAMGAFDVRVTDGVQSKTFRLERAYYGLYIPPMIWAEQLQFSSGGICLVLASHGYSEVDYIRDYGEYLKRMAGGRERGAGNRSQGTGVREQESGTRGQEPGVKNLPPATLKLEEQK